MEVRKSPRNQSPKSSKKRKELSTVEKKTMFMTPQVFM